MNTPIIVIASIWSLSPYALAVTAGYLIADGVVTKAPEHAKKVQKVAIVIGATATGAVIGSAIPVVGTAVGAGIGFVVGGLIAIFS
jgi:hypothetical protein